MEQLKSVTFSVLNSLNISDLSIASEWISRIMEMYSEKNRYYHNVEMLEKKMELIEELSVSNELRNSLALASVFQYFHFDGKSDHKEENCEEFRLFVDQAGIKDVS